MLVKLQPRRFSLRNEKGQGMTEYLIITALIAVAAIAVFAFFGKTIRDQVAGLSAEVSGQSAQSQISNAQTAANTANTAANKTKNLSSYTNASAGQ